MKTNLKSNILITSAIFTTSLFATSVNLEQKLLSDLANSNYAELDSDVVITKPLKLLRGQSLKGNGHNIVLNASNSSCQINLDSGVSISNTNFISQTDNTDLICGNNVENISINSSNIISSGSGSNAVVLTNSNSILFSADQFVKSGTGNVLLVNSSQNINITGSNISSTSTDSAIVLNNTSSSNFINNTLTLSTGSSIVQVGIVANGGNLLSINNNKITTSSTNADCIRIISGNDFVISGNKFILGQVIPALSIGIFFGNNNEAPFTITNITIANNDFSQYTIYSSGYLPALNFSATSNTTVNSTLSVGNIIGSNQLYGGAEKGAVISGAVSFTDGAIFPKAQ